MSANSARIGLYGVCRWDGAPFAGGPQQVVIDHARFGTVSLEATPILHLPWIASALRNANPSLRLIAFMDLAQRYFNPDHSLDPATDFTRECFDAVAAIPDGRGFVWSAKYPGCWFDPLTAVHVPGRWSLYNMNLACQEAVDALAAVVIRRIFLSGLFNGLICDQAQHSIVWASGGSDVIDYARAGFATPFDQANINDFDIAYRAGHRRFFQTLSNFAPSDFAIKCNASDTDPLEATCLAGQMVEGFPAGPWIKVIQGIWQREHDRIMAMPAAPRENWINMPWSSLAELQFGFASALLTDSARFTCSGTNARPDPDGREQIWSPLYGELGNIPIATDWLGPPRGRPTLTAGGCWVRGFDNGYVRVDPANRIGEFFGRRS